MFAQMLGKMIGHVETALNVVESKVKACDEILTKVVEPVDVKVEQSAGKKKAKVKKGEQQVEVKTEEVKAKSKRIFVRLKKIVWLCAGIVLAKVKVVLVYVNNKLTAPKAVPVAPAAA